MPPIENIKTGLLALGAILILLVLPAYLDGQSATEVDAAVAAEAIAAPLDAREQARLEWLEQFAEARR